MAAGPGAPHRAGALRAQAAEFQLARRGPLGALHKGVIRGLREVIGVVGDHLGRGENEHIKHRAVDPPRCDMSRQTKALSPVIALPMISVFISRVPS